MQKNKLLVSPWFFVGMVVVLIGAIIAVVTAIHLSRAKSQAPMVDRIPFGVVCTDGVARFNSNISGISKSDPIWIDGETVKCGTVYTVRGKEISVPDLTAEFQKES